MKKIIILISMVLVLFGCETVPMNKVSIEDQGIKEIQEGYYLKRIYIQDYYDVVYFIVDKNGKIIEGASTEYSVGKIRKSVSSVVVPEMDTAIIDDFTINNIDSSVKVYRERLENLKKYNELKKKLGY